jgi:hypothetical protein
MKEILYGLLGIKINVFYECSSFCYGVSWKIVFFFFAGDEFASSSLSNESDKSFNPPCVINKFICLRNKHKNKCFSKSVKKKIKVLDLRFAHYNNA